MEQLLDYNLPPKAQALVNMILLWIGFAMVVGFAARIFVPGKLAQNPYIIFLIGLTGGCLGPLIISHYYQLTTFNPIGPLGFLSAVLASICCLIIFYILIFFFKIVPHKRIDEDDSDDTD
ncbi:MAG: hypothetical protein Q4C95_01060 [Planctomycetia bacterium]|nr:hypothetical protein [Planctomycetia bacterium]